METLKFKDTPVARTEALKSSTQASRYISGPRMDGLKTSLEDMSLEKESSRRPRQRRLNKKKNMPAPHTSKRQKSETVGKDSSARNRNAAPSQAQVQCTPNQDSESSNRVPSNTPILHDSEGLRVHLPQSLTNLKSEELSIQPGKPLASLSLGAKNVAEDQSSQTFSPYEPIKSAPPFLKVPSWRADKYHRFASHQALQSPLAATTQSPTLGRWKGLPPPTARYNPRSLTTEACKPQSPVRKMKIMSGPEFELPEPVVVPRPEKTYQSIARRPASRLEDPQCLLLVLDLNGTLLYRKLGSSSYKPRPFLPQFLDYCLSNHKVLIWSSATSINVSQICARLFTPKQRRQLLGEWARDTLGLTPAQYVAKTQVFKRLDRIWNNKNLQRTHHLSEVEGKWGQHNTLLLDDSRLKASAQPYNLVQMPEFTRSGDKSAGLDVLGQVTSYLEEARMWNNVSSFVNREGFEADCGHGWDWNEMKHITWTPPVGSDQEDGGVKI